MLVPYKYNCDRDVSIEYVESDPDLNILTQNAYNIVLLNKGLLSLQIDQTPLLCVAPCVLIVKENLTIKLLSSKTFQAQIIRFDVSFINNKITYDMVNSGDYDRQMEEFMSIPLYIFYKNTGRYILPLAKEEHHLISGLFNKFNLLVSNRMGIRWKQKARIYLIEILEYLNDLYMNFSDSNINALFNKRDSNLWVSFLLEKIQTNYSQRISLSTLANDIHINKTTVSKEFKNATGYSVTDYIIHYRIKCACRSLTISDLKISRIAYECGFGSEQYFIKQFCNRIGMTPTQYRILSREQDL